MEKNSNFEMLLMDAINKCDGVVAESTIKEYQLLYPFTTENIAGYINQFNLSNGNLLTVGSSGDQIINASLYDCQNIVCLDICPYAKFYTYLKISCLLELNKNEFLKFLSYKYKPLRYNKSAFNNIIYKKIKSTLRLLDYESYLFWDELFSNFKGLNIRRELFYYDEYPSEVIIKCNPYLQSDILYDETKKKIKKTKLEFITDDIIKARIDKQFNSIWLSNIGTNISRHFLKIMIDNVSKNLDNNGILLLSYLYKMEFVKNVPHQLDWSPIYNLERTLELLQEYNPQLLSFIGVDGIKSKDITQQDSILVYRKNKK